LKYLYNQSQPPPSSLSNNSYNPNSFRTPPPIDTTDRFGIMATNNFEANAKTSEAEIEELPDPQEIQTEIEDVPADLRDVESQAEEATPEISELYQEKFVTPRRKPFTTPIKNDEQTGIDVFEEIEEHSYTSTSERGDTSTVVFS
jgi:hypothetical protein